MVTINAPSGDKGISVRLISKVRRRGMAWVLSQGQEDGKVNKGSLRKLPLRSSSTSSAISNVHLETDPSPYLLVHIHGGGFIALSSETHDVSGKLPYFMLSLCEAYRSLIDLNLPAFSKCAGVCFLTSVGM